MGLNDSGRAEKSAAPHKWLLLGLLVLTAGTTWWWFGDQLSLSSLARREEQLRLLQTQHPALVYGIAFGLYVTVTGLSLPGALGMSLLYGWYFGWLPGVLLVSFASTTGATMAFLLSRYFFRDPLQRKYGAQLARFNEALREEGAYYLFTLRLIPLVPFFVINAVMGLTPLSTLTFWWVSQLGMLPATVIYLYAGSRVPSLTTLAEQGVYAALTPSQLTQAAVAFAAVGLFPLVVRLWWRRPPRDP